MDATFKLLANCSRMCIKTAGTTALVTGVVSVACLAGVAALQEREGRTLTQQMWKLLSHERSPKYPNPHAAGLKDIVPTEGDEEVELRDCLNLHEEKRVEDDGSETVVRVRATVNRHRRGHFLRNLVAEAKNHFGGTPRMTKANELAAMKFLVGVCREKHLTMTQTREHCTAAMVALFTPDHFDIAMAKELNSHEAYKRVVALHEAQTVERWWWKLLKHPLTKENWEVMWYVLHGAPPPGPRVFIR